VQDSSWAHRPEVVGDDDRLVGSAGALPLRLLAERTGLRTGLSTAMTRRGFTPVCDRGPLLVDLAVIQLLGGEVISDFQGLRHLAPVIGPIPSTPTVWRAMAEVGERQLSRGGGQRDQRLAEAGGLGRKPPRTQCACADDKRGPTSMDHVILRSIRLCGRTFSRAAGATPPRPRRGRSCGCRG
jgi:hypothetical protein